MPYGPWDEYFVHQLPRTLDHVHDSDPSWSDRCYFNVHADDGSFLLVTGYGNNPNQQRAVGYAKIALADGRHFDLDAWRKVVGDRGDLYAGPLRWTCVEPMKRWLLECGPNESGIEYELFYESRAPLWELLPIEIHQRGRTVADMTHIKQPGRYRGWVQYDGERHSVDGYVGSRDRTFGVRASEQLDFWVWISAQLGDSSLEAYIFEAHDGTIQYCDGGFTNDDGSQSARMVKFEHDVTFDGDGKRPLHADLVFTTEDGEKIRLTADADHPNVAAWYGRGPKNATVGRGMSHYTWHDGDETSAEVAEATVSMDQLMHFRMGDREGFGIFELYAWGRGYDRYPNWTPTVKGGH